MHDEREFATRKYTTKKALTLKWRKRDGECITRNSRHETVHAEEKKIYVTRKFATRKLAWREYTVKMHDWKIRCETSVFPTERDARWMTNLKKFAFAILIRAASRAK